MRLRSKEIFGSSLTGTLSYQFHAHTRLILIFTITALTLFAWSNRFIQDDAFISFRYAENLVNGNGLVWNAGERIEGYTNFLWVLVIAIGITTGCDPVAFCYFLCMIFYPTTLYLFFKLCKRLFNSDAISFLGIILLGTNYTFSIYATGGLETHFLTMLIVACATIAVSIFTSNSRNNLLFLAASFLFAAVVLTRPDGIISSGIIMTCIAMHAVRTFSRKECIRQLILLFAPALFIISVWLIWKLQYYGTVLPNSFYAKTASGQEFEVGLKYLHRFFMSYALYPVLALLLCSAVYCFRRMPFILWMIMTNIIVWPAYVAMVGGDFMEFRFMVTYLPFLIVMVLWVAFRFITNLSVRVLIVCMVVAGNLHHVLTFAYDRHYEIESREMLHGHLYNQNEQWINVGKLFGEAFRDVPEATLAVTTAGAVPFYSKLTCIDMLGLNDIFVPRYGMFLSDRPGHQRIAPLSYLMKRKVNIVISHPTVVPKGQPPTIVPFLPRYPDEPLPDARLLEIPLDANYKIFVWYLNPTLKINTVIQQKGWKAFRNTASIR